MAGIETQILWLVQQFGSLHQLMSDTRGEMREGREAIAELKVEILRRQDEVKVILARIYQALRNLQRNQTRGTTGVHTATSSLDSGSGNSQGHSAASQALEWTPPANPMPLPDSQPAANGSSNGIVRLAPPLPGDDRLETENHRRSCPDAERTVEERVWPQSQQDGVGEDESNSMASAATRNDSASSGRFGQATQDDVERDARLISLVRTIASQLQQLETQGNAVAWQLRQMDSRVTANGEGQQAILARLDGRPSFAGDTPDQRTCPRCGLTMSISEYASHNCRHSEGDTPDQLTCHLCGRTDIPAIPARKYTYHVDICRHSQPSRTSRTSSSGLGQDKAPHQLPTAMDEQANLASGDEYADGALTRPATQDKKLFSPEPINDSMSSSDSDSNDLDGQGDTPDQRSCPMCRRIIPGFFHNFCRHSEPSRTSNPTHGGKKSIMDRVDPTSKTLMDYLLSRSGSSGDEETSKEMDKIKVIELMDIDILSLPIINTNKLNTKRPLTEGGDGDQPDNMDQQRNTADSAALAVSSGPECACSVLGQDKAPHQLPTAMDEQADVASGDEYTDGALTRPDMSLGSYHEAEAMEALPSQLHHQSNLGAISEEEDCCYDDTAQPIDLSLQEVHQPGSGCHGHDVAAKTIMQPALEANASFSTNTDGACAAPFSTLTVMEVGGDLETCPDDSESGDEDFIDPSIFVQLATLVCMRSQHSMVHGTREEQHGNRRTMHSPASS